MMSKISIPSFYLYNYHSLNIVACLIVIALRFIVGDNYFESVPYIDMFINYSLIAIIITNSALLVKSFMTKTYTSINETRKDTYLMMTFIIMLAFKSSIMMLTLFRWMINFKDDYMNGTINVLIGCFFILYFITYLFFLYFGLLGIRHRIKHVKIDNHWVFPYLSDKQIRSVKTYQEEGKVIGIYFKGFIVNEKENELILNNKSLNLNSFKFYMNSKQCKLDDLTDDDIAIIEMLGI